MIKRKSIVISLLIFCVALHIHSDNIKNSICIVNHEDSQLDSLYSVMGKCLYNNGYMSTGRMMMGIDKYFGSGFIYRSKSDRCYVVTCQHVIGNTKYAKLKFEGDIPVEYEKCKVLTASRSLDLCLIECPKEAEQYALESYSNEVHEGMVVQHTAQVDAGNFYHEDTNYSIRCCHIDSLVNQYESGLRTGKSLEESIEGFKDAVKRGSADMAYYISSMWALSLDCKELTMLLKYPSQSIDNEIRSGYPLYGISCLIAETIRSNISNVNDFTVLIEEENDVYATTVFTDNENRWHLYWVKELDEWKVISDDSKDSSLANECTCELEDVITENSDAINIAISKYKDVVCERHKFDKSKCEVFVVPTFYSKSVKRSFNIHPPYLQDVYASNYYVYNKSDSITYEFEWSDWYKDVIEYAKRNSVYPFDECQRICSEFSAETCFVLSFVIYEDYYICKSSEHGICIIGDRYNEYPYQNICDIWNEASYLVDKKGLKKMLICHLHTESVKDFVAKNGELISKMSPSETGGAVALRIKPCKSKKLTDKFLENLDIKHPVYIKHGSEYTAMLDSIKPDCSFYIYGDNDYSLFYIKNGKLRVLCHPDEKDKAVIKDMSYDGYYQTYVGRIRYQYRPENKP